MAVGAPPPAGEGISMHPSSHSARHSGAGTFGTAATRASGQEYVEQIFTFQASQPGSGRSPIDLNNGRTAAAAPREKEFLHTPPARPRLRGVAPVALPKNFGRPHVPRAAVARHGDAAPAALPKNFGRPHVPGASISKREAMREAWPKIFGRPHVPGAAISKRGASHRRRRRKTLDDPMYREPAGSSQRLTAPSRSAGGRRGAAS
jgi:hypothetical protein